MRSGIAPFLARLAMSYSIASIAASVMLAGLSEGHPHVPLPAILIVLVFPIVPPVLAYSAVTRLFDLGGPRSVDFFVRDVFCLVFFSAFFVAGWITSGKLLARRRARVRSTPPSVSGRHPATERALESGRTTALAHLVDPEYIGDYANARSMTLDSVLALVREGKISSHVHEGVVFVGQKRVGRPA